METFRKYLTNNKCYKVGAKLKPVGIMLHSTACKGVKAKTFLKSWNTETPNGRLVCVHGFLDNTGFYQTLPFDMRAWHCGGNGNNTHIGFEICEPKDYADKEYFEIVKKYAIDVCITLIKEFNLSVNDITCHCEAYQKNGAKFASNHSDIDHWWKKYFNYTMDNFRQDVKKELEVGEMNEEVSDWAKIAWKWCCDRGYMDGTNPKGTITREMLAQVIYNMYGKEDKCKDGVCNLG